MEKKHIHNPNANNNDPSFNYDLQQYTKKRKLFFLNSPFPIHLLVRLAHPGETQKKTRLRQFL